MMRLLNGVNRRIRLMIGRCVVRLVNDASAMQELQITGLGSEVLDALEHFQAYGLTSVPHAGAEGLVLNLAGSRALAVVINVDDRRYRLTGLQPGEVALYDDLGQTIELRRNGIYINAAHGDVHVTGDVIADGISLKTHTHGGVQPGGGSTGVPQ